VISLPASPAAAGLIICALFSRSTSRIGVIARLRVHAVCAFVLICAILMHIYAAICEGSLHASSGAP